jgi:hypothetical protein
MKRWNGRSALVLVLACLALIPQSLFGVEVPQWVIDEAVGFAGIHTIVTTVHPQVNNAHTQFYQVHGIANISGTDRECVVIVTGSELDPQVVGYIRLCPRYADLSDVNNYTESEVITIAEDWRTDKGFTIPAGYTQETPVLSQVGEELRWEIFWTHNFVSGPYTGRVVSDFILVEVDAEEGEVITYSKVHHAITPDTDPDISESQALTFAEGHLTTLGFSSSLPHLGTELAVVYPNDYFTNYSWAWSEDQSLCWIVQFGDSLDVSEPGIDIWVEANGTGGELRGGEIYENPVGELHGIPDQEADTDTQKVYLEMMQYDLTGKIHKGNTTEATVTGDISDADNFLFILHTHGKAENGKEHARISTTAAGDARYFSSDEVPAHTLHYALISCCHSGDSGGDGPHFKDSFRSQYTGGSYFCFQGYEGSINPDHYEGREFYHLSLGKTLQNAHNAAKTETGIKFKVVFTYQGACYNKIRLAPLQVTVWRMPPTNVVPYQVFLMMVNVKNREDAGSTQATGVWVQLVIPPEFELAAPLQENPKSLGSLNSGDDNTASWYVRAKMTTAPGTYTFDALVWSDNLGVEVDDPDDPYHKHDVTVVAEAAAQLSHFAARSDLDVVKIDWITVSEINTTGFNIHRGIDPHGSYSQVNETLIPSRSDGLSGASYSYVDADVVPGLEYYYWLEEVDVHGAGRMFGPIKVEAGGGDEDEADAAPIAFGLKQNYPNPFNPVTEITYDLPFDSHVRLEVYNVLGRKVATLVDEHQKAGSKVITWTGRNDAGEELSSGVYFYRLEAGSHAFIKKMILLR